jgi:adenosylcobinamide amidohydrolase
MVAGVVAAPYALEERSRWLIVRFREPWNLLSWCVVNGGFQRTTTVAWLYLRQNEIADVIDPADWLRAQAHREGLGDAVTFMTSRRLHRRMESSAKEMNCHAWAIGTLGLSNAMRAGDAPQPASSGTINLLVCVDVALTREAALEALGITGEAKTLAVLESRTPSIASQAPATGTGTDYMAVAWPTGGAMEPYSGKHTAVGSAIAQAAFNAVTNGIMQWRAETGVQA